MSIDLKYVAKRIVPANTVLLFGAGSSVPSGAPTGSELSARLAKNLGFPHLAEHTLPDTAGIIAKKTSRLILVKELQAALKDLKPTRGLLNLPMADWREIYTTNYDTLIEQAYRRSQKRISVVSSNFELNADAVESDIPIYKLHGTIEKDVSLGDATSRIIITQSDYDLTDKHREALFDRFKDQINRSDLIVVGSTLSDPDLRAVIDRAIRVKREGASGSIYLLIYEPDEDRAALYEDRGIQVCFGGIDEFVDSVIANLASHGPVYSILGDAFDVAPGLRTSCLDVSHAFASQELNVSRLFQGRSASYGDIARGATFLRDEAPRISNYLTNDDGFIALVMGVAGVGKTSLCRQILSTLSSDGLSCWEHDDNRPLDAKSWFQVAKWMNTNSSQGVLFVDDCHEHLRQINSLVESLCAENISCLKLLLVTNPQAWNHRIKSPLFYSNQQTFRLRNLSHGEIEAILNLLEKNDDIRKLVEPKFLGFSRSEMRSRLSERCGSDTFVCMKNIFAFDTIDEIILNEYAAMDEGLREIYRHVAALEASGVRIHRQFILRTLALDATKVRDILDKLTDTILETEVDRRQGIYTWSGRHTVISEIITNNEFRDQEEFYKFLCTVADNINPTYQIELRSVRELCARSIGILKLHDKNKQNVVLRKLISSAPGERVPRHRLISNLIELKDFAGAEGEIRIYEKEFSNDAVLSRLQIESMLRRAEVSERLLSDHRANIARDAASMAERSIERFPDNKSLYEIYLRLGRFVVNTTGKWDLFDIALDKAQRAEPKILDPEMTRIITRFENWAARVVSPN